jgi:hypothetical protein
MVTIEYLEALAESDRLEALSFRNLVRFYASELNEIRRGGDPCLLFSVNQRRSLYSHGVLIYRHRYRAGAGVSPRAIEILEVLG